MSRNRKYLLAWSILGILLAVSGLHSTAFAGTNGTTGSFAAEGNKIAAGFLGVMAGAAAGGFGGALFNADLLSFVGALFAGFMGALLGTSLGDSSTDSSIVLALGRGLGAMSNLIGSPSAVWLVVAIAGGAGGGAFGAAVGGLVMVRAVLLTSGIGAILGGVLLDYISQGSGYAAVFGAIAGAILGPGLLLLAVAKGFVKMQSLKEAIDRDPDAILAEVPYPERPITWDDLGEGRTPTEELTETRPRDWEWTPGGVFRGVIGTIVGRAVHKAVDERDYITSRRRAFFRLNPDARDRAFNLKIGGPFAWLFGQGVSLQTYGALGGGLGGLIIAVVTIWLQ